MSKWIKVKVNDKIYRANIISENIRIYHNEVDTWSLGVTFNAPARQQHDVTFKILGSVSPETTMFALPRRRGPKIPLLLSSWRMDGISTEFDAILGFDIAGMLHLA